MGESIWILLKIVISKVEINWTTEGVALVGWGNMSRTDVTLVVDIHSENSLRTRLKVLDSLETFPEVVAHC